jgi:acyl carrier protein
MAADVDIMTVVVETIVDILDLDDGSMISESTTAKDVRGWDSLHHVRIMLSLEKKFNFRWTDSEISSVEKVGDIVSIIARKL